MAVRKKFGSALGRGLDALISTEDVRTEGSSTINEIDISLIERNPNQPRREFDEDALQELADSIAEIENIQRQDLNSIEIALAYQHLIDEYGLTQEKLSERVGKKRATVANYLRLLKLPAPVQVAIQNHHIDTGHARALLALDDPKAQLKLFRDIQNKGYSVRQVEDMIKGINGAGQGKPSQARTVVMPKQMEDEFENVRGMFFRAIGTDVKISCSSKGGGKISIPFKDADALRRIISLFSKIG